MSFKEVYSNTILPKYGIPRNISQDNDLIKNSQGINIYSIQNRLNLEHIKSFSIDPDGCEDADDAFSIYSENEKLYLAIHIADPTHYIQINSPLWKNILERTVTRYPSNHSPIHLMPKEIVDKASLMENKYGPYKNAISVITEISPKTNLPINNVKICYTKIFIPGNNNLSYQKASLEANYDTDIGDILRTGLLISEALNNNRDTLGKKINNHLNSTIKYIDGQPIFIKDTQMIKSMKEMIAEFAIFANSIVGKYLTYHLNGLGIYRTCESKDWLETLDTNISGDDLMNKIIDNGISADYQSSVLSHDLVGSEEYSHFTSPIRRVSDCVCHYLLKYIYLSSSLEVEFPFSKKELDLISGRCQSMTKYMRKIQFQDTKLRTIQTISNIKNSFTVKISVRFVSYSGLFVNFIINKIIYNNEEHKVSVSYVLRIRDYQFISYWKLNTESIITINEINLPGRFDENTLPELDNFIKNPYMYSEGNIYDKYVNKNVILHNWDGVIQKNLKIIENNKVLKCLLIVNYENNLSTFQNVLNYDLIGPDRAVTKIEFDQ